MAATVRTMEAEQTTIKDLPNEMMAQILKCTDYASKRSCRQVCSRWRRILDGQFLQLDAILDESTYKYVLSCQNSIVNLTVDELKSSLPISTTRNANYFSSLALGLKFRSPISQDNLLKILSTAGNIKYLIFNNLTLQNLKSNSRIWKCLRVDALVQLQLSLERFEINHHSAVVNLLNVAEFPALEMILLRFEVIVDLRKTSKCAERYPAEAYYQLYPSVFRFLVRHQSRVKKFAFFTPNNFNGFNSSLPTIEKLVSKYDSKSFDHELPSIQLDTYAIGLTAEEFGKAWSLARRLLSFQSALKFLVLIGRPLFEEDALRIQANSSTLEKLVVASTPPLSRVEANVGNGNPLTPIYEFDCQLLEHCERLAELSIVTIAQVHNIHLLPISLTKLTWSSMLRHEELQLITRQLVSLNTLVLSIRSCIESGLTAQIIPITLEIFIHDILPMPKLERLNLQSYCELNALKRYCTTTVGVKWIMDIEGFTICINKKELARNP